MLSIRPLAICQPSMETRAGTLKLALVSARSNSRVDLIDSIGIGLVLAGPVFASDEADGQGAQEQQAQH